MSQTLNKILLIIIKDCLSLKLHNLQENESARKIGHVTKLPHHHFNLHPETITPNQDVVKKCVAWLRGYLKGEDQHSPTLREAFKNGSFIGYRIQTTLPVLSEDLNSYIIPLSALPVCSRFYHKKIQCSTCMYEVNSKILFGTKKQTVIELPCGHSAHAACLPTKYVIEKMPLKKFVIEELKYMWYILIHCCNLFYYKLFKSNTAY